MTPNFALFLYADGIRMLARQGEGWGLLGVVDPQDDEMAAKLEAFHARALEHAPDGLACNLVLPESQVRFLVAERTSGSSGDLTVAAAALEGATPYTIDELAFDVHGSGSTLHIAAVAHETLQEAEAFAADHGFNPLCFSAAPPAASPDWAPHFGTAQSATDAGLIATREHRPIVETPDIVFARQDVASSASSETMLFASRRNSSTLAPDAMQATSPSVLSLRSRISLPHASAAGFDEAPELHDPQIAVEAVSTLTSSMSREEEAERLTVFGARDKQQEVKPRSAVRRILAASVALFCVGAGAWAIYSYGTGSGVPDAPLPTAQLVAPEPTFVSPDAMALDGKPSTDLPTNTPKTLPARATLTDEDTAVLDAMRAPALSQPDLQKIAPVIEDDLRAHYAVTGVWVTPPDVPAPAEQIDVDGLYVPSIDPIKLSFDVVALPDIGAQVTDVSLPAPAAPAAAGTTFELNEKGLVTPSEQGTLNPDGIAIFSGPPPGAPPERPTVDALEQDTRFAAVAEIRPAPRPDDLIETNERANLAGLTRSELAEWRPRARPQSAQENALASASLVPLGEDSTAAALVQDGSIVSATTRAVPQSLRPDARPNNFDSIVADSRRAADRASTAAASAAPVRTASVAPQSVAPRIPSNASVTREATIQNAINLRKINLIGVYGKPSDRRALVRLANGRYRKVQVGDRIDGGRISAIGDAELRYQKSGRNVVLKMPRG